jgi:hypothetical protein
MLLSGRDIAKMALREIGVLDPIEPGKNELIADTLTLASLMLDRWRVKRLTIRGIIRSEYPLLARTQTYQLGDQGAFAQIEPESIVAWSVIPDRTAAEPQEIPMGEPLNWAGWQAIRVKSQTAPWPRRMWFENQWGNPVEEAPLVRVSFHPIPSRDNVGVVLYQRVPAVKELLADTKYQFEPAFADALILQLALRAAGRHKVPLSDIPDTAQHANEALADLMRAHSKLIESPMRPEFSIGGGSSRVGGFNVYTGGR